MSINEFVKANYVDRRHTDSVKWDALLDLYGDENLLSLWVADMDFKAPQAALDAMQDYLKMGALGYRVLPSRYYQAYQTWMEDHFTLHVEEDWIRFSPGVVAGIHYILAAFTKKDDPILLQTPIYAHFFDLIEESGRPLVEVPLLYRSGQGYQCDFENFEAKIIEAGVKVYLHCSPHNPIGRVWTEAEQARLFEICHRHGVLIISDEIHQDFTFDDHIQIPALKVEQGKYQNQIFTLNSTSKTFNMAGLSHAHLVIPDPKLRAQYDQYWIERAGHPNINSLAAIGTQVAYEQGKTWLDQVKAVIYHNYLYIKDKFKENLPMIAIDPLEGTYLLYINIEPLLGSDSVQAFCQEKAKIAVNYGVTFRGGTDTYIRVNLATRPENIEDFVQRMIALSSGSFERVNE